jgi:hypothetical protein
LVLKKHIGRADREILAAVAYIFAFSKKPYVHDLSRQLRIARIALPALS